MLLGSMARALKPGGKFFIEVRSVHDPLYGKGRRWSATPFSTTTTTAVFLCWTS